MSSWVGEALLELEDDSEDELEEGSEEELLEEEDGTLELDEEDGTLLLDEDVGGLDEEEGRAEELETGAALLESVETSPNRWEEGDVEALSGRVAGEVESETGVFMARRKMNGLSTHRTEKQE